MRYRTPLLALSGLLGLLLYSTGCDSASNPVAPAGSVLTVTANPGFIDLGGESAIKVTGFRPDGNPLSPGTQISVSTTLGVLASTLIAVSDQGQAETVLRSSATGQPGMATVTARLAGGDAEATAMVEIGNRMASLILDPNPSTIRVQQCSLVQILARDSNGNPVGAGERIRITADLGTTFRCPATAQCPSGEMVSEVFTDGNGEACVQFRAGGRAGMGEVAAVLGNSEQATASITIIDTPTDFTFEVSDTTIPSGGGDLTLRATVINAEGDVLPNIVVIFGSDIAGSFTPSSSVQTNSSGVAETMVTYTETQLGTATNGMFDVTATVTLANGSRTDRRRITIN